jgi:HSP20 family protein
MRWDGEREYLDPFELFRQLQKEIDSIFSQFERPFFDFTSKPRMNTQPTAPTNQWRSPFIDLFDKGDKFIIIAELPGVKKEDINLRVTPNKVLIEARLERENSLEEESIVKLERYYMGYRREIELPEEVIPEKATAHYKNGVLEMELPKKHPSQQTKGVTINIL